MVVDWKRVICQAPATITRGRCEQKYGCSDVSVAVDAASREFLTKKLVFLSKMRANWRQIARNLPF